MPAVLPIAVAIVGAITEAGAIVGASIGALAGGALGLGAADTLALSASLGGVFGSAFVEGAGLFVLATASQLLESQPKIAGTQVDFMADPQTGVPYLFGRTGTGGKIVMTDSAGKNSAFLTYITVDSLGPIQGYESFQANTIVTQFDADNGEGAGHQTPTTTAQQPVPAGATTIQVGTTDGFGTTSGTGVSSSITISGGGNSETRTLSRVDQSPKELSWGTPLTHSYPEYAQITGSSVTSGFLNRMWLKESLGPANAPYLTFTSTDSKDTPANHSGIPTVWTSSCQLSGLAATMWTLEFDAQVYSGGTPRPLKVARGVFGYDPRLDSTYAGGSGSCRANNEATWIYSENPYVHALTWLIGRTANGVKTMGVHAPLNAIDIPAFVIGMNVADANGWKCGGVVMSTDSKWTVLTTMLQAGAGTPLKLGAKISCMVSTPLVSLDTLTGADVVGKATIAGTTPSRERINAIWPRYREEQQGWQIVPTQTPVIVASYVTVDGGQRTKETEYTLCQDASQAATLARYDIENAREIQPITLPCKPRWMGYKPGDCITVNEPEYELVNQTCLIVSREVDPATLITTLGLRTETFAKHAFALGQTGVAPVTPTMNGFDPSVFAGPLAGAWTATGSTIVSGAQTVPCIDVTGASDNALAASVIFEYSEAGANDWQIWAETPAATTTGTQITGLAPSKAYDVGVCYRSVKGVISGLTVITPPDAAITGAGSYGAVVGSGPGNPGTLTSAAGGSLYIGDVVTSQGTSNNTSNVGSMSASAVNSGIADIATALADAQAALGETDNAALAILQLGSLSLQLQGYFKALAFVDGLPPGPLLAEVQKVGGQSVETLNLIGYKSNDGTEFILNDNNVSYSDGTNIADYNQSISSQIDANSAGVIANTALINVNNETQTTATSAVASSVTALEATVAGNGSAAVVEYQTIANEISTEAEARTTLASIFSGFQATASSQILTLSNSTEALAAEVINLTASTGSDSSSVSVELTALTTSLASTAAEVTTLSATADGLTSTVTAQGIAISTATGQLYGSYTLNVAAGNVIAGIQLLAESGSTTISAFIIQAGVFEIELQPGSTASVQPFFYDTTTSTLSLQNLDVHGDLIVSGTVTTGSIADNAVTNTFASTASSSVSGSGAEALVFSQTLTLEAPASVVVHGSVCFVDGGGHAAGDHSSTVRITINGTQEGYNSINGSVATSTLAALGELDCGAGSVTVNLYATTESFDSYTYRTLITSWFYR